MTRIQRSRTTIGLLTAAGSALIGYFAESSVAASTLSNTAAFSLASDAAALYDVIRWPSPTSMVVRPKLPASPLLLFTYGTPRFTSADFATSHEEVNLLVPTGLNWTEHCRGSEVTTTGAACCAASSAGFAKWVIAR